MHSVQDEIVEEKLEYHKQPVSIENPFFNVYLNVLIVLLYNGARTMKKPFQTGLFLSEKMQCCPTLNDGES